MRHSAPARRLPRWLAGFAVGAAVLLTACTPVTSGSAAVVGDATMPLSQVSDSLQEIQDLAAAKELDAPDPAQTNLRLVGLWVEESLTEQLAAQEGVTASDGDVAKFLARFSESDLAQISVNSGIPLSEVDRAARTQLLQVQLAQQLAPTGTADEQAQALRAALAQTAEEVGVSVNPRFGSFDATIAQVTERDAERLSSPAPTDSAAPLLPQG